MRISLLVIFMFIVANTCYPQDNSTPDISNITKISIIPPGINYEHRIGRLQSLYVHLFAALAGGVGYSSSLGFTTELNIYPAIKAQYRYYYNGTKRQSKGKRTDMNSMNYISPMAEALVTKTKFESDNLPKNTVVIVPSFGVVWGMQRNYSSNLYLDINVGPGYYFTKEIILDGNSRPVSVNVSGFTLLAQIHFGFWLNSRK